MTNESDHSPLFCFDTIAQSRDVLRMLQSFNEVIKENRELGYECVGFQLDNFGEINGIPVHNYRMNKCRLVFVKSRKTD